MKHERKRLKKGSFYMTRDFRKVRIYDYSGTKNTHYDVHGAIRQDDDTWMSTCWKRNGKYRADEAQHCWDIVGLYPKNWK